MSRNLYIDLLVLVAAAGTCFALRSYRWERVGLDYDEPATLYEVDNVDRRAIVDYLTLKTVRNPQSLSVTEVASRIELSFPAYYYLAHEVQTLFGGDQIRTLRWLSIALGTALVPVLYMLGRSFNRTVAWLSVMLGIVHPAFQFHSQYIRFYAWLILLSAAAVLWYMWCMPRILSWRTHSALRWRLWSLSCIVIAAVFPALLLMTHAGGAVVIVALLIIAYGHLGFRRPFALVSIWSVLLAAVPLINAANFFYQRMADPHQRSSNIMSAGALPALGALAFILGAGICLMCAWWVGRRLTDVRRVAQSLSVATRRSEMVLCLSVIAAFIAIAGLVILRHELFRADYALGIYPLVLVGCALGIYDITSLCGTWRPALTAVIAALAMLPSVPTFVSNLAIDGDRLDRAEIIKFLHDDVGKQRALVFTDSPGTFRRLDKHRPDTLRYEQIARASDFRAVKRDRTYWLIHEIKGFTYQFHPDYHVPGELVHIFGRSRLDLRSTRAYLFRQHAGAAADDKGGP